jgi:lipoate-protein ligase B
MTAMGAAAYLLDLPVTDYGRAHRLQVAAVTARHHGPLDGDLVMMLEHAPVFTLGRRGGRDNLLVPAQWLRSRDIEVVPIERGGDITYHGPGQLVVYILMDIASKSLGVRDFVDRLETAMARTAARWGVTARGDSTHRGAWVGQRKLGSVGITVRRGITFHGLAFNVGVDLEPFRWIHPCGLKACQMTSLEKEAGRQIDMGAVRGQMAQHLGDLLELALTPIGMEELVEKLGDDYIVSL